MAKVYLRSTTGQTLTFEHGTTIGPIPTLIDEANLDYTLALESGNVEQLTESDAKQLIRLAQTGKSRLVKQGTLAKGPITVAVGTTWNPTALDTTGFTYAMIWPKTVSGGAGNVSRRQYTLDGVLSGVDNASNGAAPQGMADQGYVMFYHPPINDKIVWVWSNTDATNATVIGDINYTLTT